mmetsp:Transcript_22828/g.58117  ORF Transcript_22828/g.58117 Transcript_22828/m.58117 type:complete len:268 (-) Transcript_22828:501-1304(-)
MRLPVEPHAQPAPRHAPEDQPRRGPGHAAAGGLLQGLRGEDAQEPGPARVQAVAAPAGVDLHARGVRRPAVAVLGVQPAPAHSHQEGLGVPVLHARLARGQAHAVCALWRRHLPAGLRAVHGVLLADGHVPVWPLLAVSHLHARGGGRRPQELGGVCHGPHGGHLARQPRGRLDDGLPQLPGHPPPVPHHAAVPRPSGLQGAARQGQALGHQVQHHGLLARVGRHAGQPGRGGQALLGGRGQGRGQGQGDIGRTHAYRQWQERLRGV